MAADDDGDAASAEPTTLSIADNDDYDYVFHLLLHDSYCWMSSTHSDYH